MRRKPIKASLLTVLLLSATTLGFASPAVADTAATGAAEPVPDDLAAAVSVEDSPQPVEGSGSLSRTSSEPQCTVSDDVALCITMGAGTAEVPDANRSEGMVQPFAMVAWPSWCLAAGADAGYRGTRTSLCGIRSGLLEVRQMVNGAPTGPVVGTMNFLVYNYIYMDAGLNTWADQIRVSPTVITGAAVGTQISGTATCSGANCAQTSQTFPVQTPSAMGNADGEAYWQWTGATGQSALGTPTWTITFKSPTSVNPAFWTETSPVPVRCDNAVPGRAAIGCVVPAITPVIRYDSSSFTEFGPHVAGAQASGLRGGSYSNPMHRLVDSSLQAANRATSCPASLPRPTGKSCDEYPFASTYEGAALSGGGPRTQSWCQVTLSGPPSTGAAGYSVCMIDATQNSAAGSLLNSVLYAPFRVIDADAFYVEIV